MRTLEAQSLGEAANTVFDSPGGARITFSASGDRQGQNYWGIPVSAMLRIYMEQNTVSKLHLTGISLEGDVYANADIELFAVNIPGTLSTPSPVQIQPEDKRFQFGYGDPSLLGRMDNPRTKELTSAEFSALAQDSSIFEASLHSDKSSRAVVCEAKGTGVKPICHKSGRATMLLSKRSVDSSTAYHVWKMSARWYWRVNHSLSLSAVKEKNGVVLDYNSVLFMGVRPTTETTLHGVKSEGGGNTGAFGYLESFRVTLYLRRGMI
ncbi:hypothetical protein CABS01_16855 [Colletotrichum abscissum]|uniref:uncharacterized protein n=1 Tax=Colletotrichum abscissum TaxID=1671311 RepID=UPI0027D636FE|nr:uncharacterized protein CABS01_16855 [Colletotrichum abscissum]KAK1509291.1 hypothetical protein CABS01_16855 [Colletotrichum abscissum]